MARKAKKQEPEATVIVAFKGFDANWQCRGFQYELGRTYDNGGKPVVRCGEGGFHSCEMPLDVLSYYAPGTSRFALVEASGAIAREENSDSKLASAVITIKAEISLGDLTRRAVAWVAEKANGQYATGEYGHAAATGNYGHAAATGNSGHAAATGIRGHAATTGNYGHAAATGIRGHAAATGNWGHASATGEYGHAAATGNYGHAAATGDSGHAAATGDSGHAAATGDYGHAAATGKNAIAHAAGIKGTAKAEAGGAISLAAYDDDYNLVAVRSSLVGQNGIEAGKAYRLTTDGEFEEVKG